jgi:hypothetical protein
MADLSKMRSDQAQHLQSLREAWAEYGPAARMLEQLPGGMTWKTVKGAKYLCRYFQDPATGRKKFTSLGRRSPGD